MVKTRRSKESSESSYDYYDDLPNIMAALLEENKLVNERKAALSRVLASTITKKDAEILIKDQVIAQQQLTIASLQEELGQLKQKFGALQKLDTVSEKVRSEQRQLIASYVAVSSLSRRTKLASAHSVSYMPAQPSRAVKQEVESATYQYAESWQCPRWTLQCQRGHCNAHRGCCSVRGFLQNFELG